MSSEDAMSMHLILKHVHATRCSCFRCKAQTSSQIAQTVLRSQDTIVRVLKRFLSGGLDAVPWRMAPGRERRVTADWEAELLRVIELDPHDVGEETANWTTEQLAAYLGQQTGIHVTEETVRV